MPFDNTPQPERGGGGRGLTFWAIYRDELPRYIALAWHVCIHGHCHLMPGAISGDDIEVLRNYFRSIGKSPIPKAPDDPPNLIEVWG